MLKFGVAIMIAALALLAADWYAPALFFALGPSFAHYLFKIVAFACFSAAAFFAVPTQRRMSSLVVCGFVLTYTFVEIRTIVLLTVANGADVFVGWFATLVTFALPVWLVWLWYGRAARA